MITMILTEALNCYSEDNWDKGSKTFDLVDMSGGFGAGAANSGVCFSDRQASFQN